MSALRVTKNTAELKDILSDGLEYITSLKAVLVEERGALENRDTVLLETTSKSKETLAKNLAMFDFFRADIESLATSDDRSIFDAWHNFQSIARDCDALNRTNGAIIRARHDQVLTGLSVLQGRERDSDTYSSSGSTVGSAGRRSLTEA